MRPHVKTHKTAILAHKQLAAGAIGFLSKQHPVEEFPSALRAVHAGQSLLPAEADRIIETAAASQR